MSKPASKTLIGVFVIGAIALAVLAVVVFGSGRFFSEKMPLVMYFEGSVAGLNIGSPVMFRGVKVGIVKDIVLRFDAKDVSFLIPVYVELDPKKFLVIGKFTDEEELDRTLINKGLRATLELQSMVTGQLMVNLDFHPGNQQKSSDLTKGTLKFQPSNLAWKSCWSLPMIFLSKSFSISSLVQSRG